MSRILNRMSNIGGEEDIKKLRTSRFCAPPTYFDVPSSSVQLNVFTNTSRRNWLSGVSVNIVSIFLIRCKIMEADLTPAHLSMRRITVSDDRHLAQLGVVPKRDRRGNTGYDRRPGSYACVRSETGADVVKV